MLALRPNCECCDQDLAPDHPGAFICSFECTFCSSCAEALAHICPNCSGTLVLRPHRPAARLLAFPASVRRVKNARGCSEATEIAASAVML